LTPEAQREERQARQAAAQAANAQGSQAGDAGQRAGQGAPGGRQRGGQDQAGGRGGQSTQAGPEGGRQGRGQDQGGRGGPGGQQEARAAVTLATQSCYATLMTTLNSEKPYRTSRVEDVSRSPLVDWIDIALTAYATDTTGTNLRFMQDRLDETFPIDDVLIMSRPFVANLESFGIGGAGGGGGGERGQGGAGAAMFTMGGAPGASPLSSIMGGTGERGGGRGAGRVLPKDVQDRMMFDAQAASFFNYLMEKLGAEKVKDIIQQNVKGVESLKVVQGLLGNDMAKVEKDWVAWMKEQKLPENIR
jgi:hypothetical protein